MKVLVTGGGGFLGGAIVAQLLLRGHLVRSFSRNAYLSLGQLDVEQVQGDLQDDVALQHAAAGCDAIMHVAAKAGVWGPYQDYHLANVVGTHNVIAACRAHGVKRLVYTSTPSVVCDGRPAQGLDESAPYLPSYLTAYPQTKALAELTVLAANGPDLATIALRPPLIWGPGDRHLIPRILAKAKAGQLRRIGAGDPLIDAIYVENAAQAHVLALEKLAGEGIGSREQGTGKMALASAGQVDPQASSLKPQACPPPHSIAGRAFFLSNDEPVGLWWLVDQILAAHDLPPVQKHISYRAAYAAGAVLEYFWRLRKKPGEPPMTRFVAQQLSRPRWFNIAAAKRDLGYQPRVTMAEGLARLRGSLPPAASER